MGAVDCALQPVPVNADTACTELTSLSTTFALLDETDVKEHSGHLTVLRIVGDVTCIGQPSDGAAGVGKNLNDIILWWMGIYVTKVDDTGGFLELTPSSVVDAEASWMWRWSGAFPVGGAATDNSGTGTFPIRGGMQIGNVHVDVRVKRVLQDREVLMFAAQCFSTAGDGAGEAAEMLNLRVLTRAKG